jgi:hypothetical protein
MSTPGGAVVSSPPAAVSVALAEGERASGGTSFVRASDRWLPQAVNAKSMIPSTLNVRMERLNLRNWTSPSRFF